MERDYGQFTTIISSRDNAGFVDVQRFTKLVRYSTLDSELRDAIHDLHCTTDRIVAYRPLQNPEQQDAGSAVFRTTPELRRDSSVNSRHANLPGLMALLMEKRERAKRSYREAMAAKLTLEPVWMLDSLIEELESELNRTEQLLVLHPPRGMYH